MDKGERPLLIVLASREVVAKIGQHIDQNNT